MNDHHPYITPAIQNAYEERIIADFVASGVSRHSGHAETLHVLIGYCERNGICYVLQAAPGVGYIFTKMDGSDALQARRVPRTMVWKNYYQGAG